MSAVARISGGVRGHQGQVAITTEEPSSQLALAQRLGSDRTAQTSMRDLTDDEQDQLRLLLARLAAGTGTIEAWTAAG